MLGFSFSIGQAHDEYLLVAILQLFKLQHLKVQSSMLKSGKPFYFIEVGNLAGVTSVVEHLLVVGLQGENYVQLAHRIKQSTRLQPLLGKF